MKNRRGSLYNDCVWRYWDNYVGGKRLDISEKVHRLYPGY